MKENIHPKYEDATITCACGNVINTKSTKGDIRVEICSKCHPFFTGNRSSLIPADVWIGLRSVTICRKNNLCRAKLIA